MAKGYCWLVACLFATAVGARTASANQILKFDEFGNGTSSAGVFTNDPGPGGLTHVLTYNLPFAATQGDVLLLDGGVFLDVIRFNGNGTLIFYSDNIDGFDAPADTSGPPSAFYTNLARIAEVGTEANNGAFYTPLSGQPGSAPGMAITYEFISDGSGPPLPEPGTLFLLVSGLVGLGFERWRRRG